jgi:hypothetical protein
MAHGLFFAAAIAACLFWTAACVAAAARTERRWLRRLLAAVGVLLPLLLLLPWLVLTGYLAFSGQMPANTGNLFGLTLTAFLSALIGGLWIRRAGLSRATAGLGGSGGGFVAAAWPLFGLAAMHLIAEAVTYGTLVSIDHESLARSRALRAEAAQLMQASLPPAPAADDDAAPLYRRAFAAIEADKTLSGEKSPLSEPLAADVAAADVQAILARHAPTLDLLRRAADRPGCRFVRDWSRPSFSMRLPEFASLRMGAKLLALAARCAAADGDVAAALRDVVRIHRLGMHFADEPVLIAGWMGTAIDTVAIETLAAVLPAIRATDLPLLDEPSSTDFLGTMPSLQRNFYGEEAFGLCAMADLADGKYGVEDMGDMTGTVTRWPSFKKRFAEIFRWFLMPSELAAYQSMLWRYQDVASDTTLGYPQIKEQVAAIERDVQQRQAGLFGSLVRALGGTFRTQIIKAAATHRAAEVLVAATRYRIATATLPESAASLVPAHLPAVPRDPFTDDAPLRSRRTDDGRLVVYSVGLDGEDDGGPPAPGVEKPEGNDDVGLSIAL